ncbi:hypothetical protein [Vibrio splendidus]|uniref:Uncharacterized protein n=1 Tax=Vibrio splendidus TaxID=29497 RepID=A0A2N7K0A3_VIBSP|nr:hypothetical protein [Vibrio splendidus]PMM66453.1 hypothetical protein BCT54_15655 [Vibrio splendidus]
MLMLRLQSMNRKAKAALIIVTTALLAVVAQWLDLTPLTLESYLWWGLVRLAVYSGSLMYLYRFPSAHNKKPLYIALLIAISVNEALIVYRLF